MHQSIIFFVFFFKHKQDALRLDNFLFVFQKMHILLLIQSFYQNLPQLSIMARLKKIKKVKQKTRPGVASPRKIKTIRRTKKTETAKPLQLGSITLLPFYEPKQKRGWASNLFVLSPPIKVDGVNCSSSEKFYQAQKFDTTTSPDATQAYIKTLLSARTESIAFSLGRMKPRHGFMDAYLHSPRDRKAGAPDMKVSQVIHQAFADGVKMIPDWEDQKIAVMIRALKAKFTHQGPCRDKLMAVPRDTLLVEHTPRDRFWGDGGDLRQAIHKDVRDALEEGQSIIPDGHYHTRNHLGKLLTALKYILQVESTKNPSIQGARVLAGPALDACIGSNLWRMFEL